MYIYIILYIRCHFSKHLVIHQHLQLPSNVARRATLEGSSCTSIMTCTGGCGYSFLYS